MVRKALLRIGRTMELVLLITAALSLPRVAAAHDVKALLIASHSRGPAHWITVQAYLIGNMLEFNGVPYDFLDVGSETVTQDILDSYRGVILEGYSLRWDATSQERDLIAATMSSGGITALVGLVDGRFTELNSSIYAALGVSVDGLGSGEDNIALNAACNIYDFDGDEGFVIASDGGSKHIGVAVTPLGEWTYVGPIFSGDRVYGFEFALSTWMKNAFGVDARVTLPILTLDLCDTQVHEDYAPYSPSLIAFFDSTKHLIRASACFVTNGSAYRGTDTTFQDAEQTISKWGSASLHGKTHASVGAEGEDRNFATQYADMSEAVTFLQTHFARYKAIKACPNNSWNEATLHAMYESNVPFHSSSIRCGPDYKALYKSVFDVSSEAEREKMYARGDNAGLRYYPLYHCDPAVGDAWIYSVDWYVVIDGRPGHDNADSLMKQYGLDWWVPVMAASHYQNPGDAGAVGDPVGWMAAVEGLMPLVDHSSYPWRRWVDMHDYAASIRAFDQELTGNSISIAGNSITYEIHAAVPTRFLTLRAEKDGHRIESVNIDGLEYGYFGENYVHLPEILGSAIVTVNLSSSDGTRPHATHINPSGVIDRAGYVGDHLHLEFSGEFEVTVFVEGTSNVFDMGTTRVFADGSARLEVNLPECTVAEQVSLTLLPESGSVRASLDTWDGLSTSYRKWCECAVDESTTLLHELGGLQPYCPYDLKVNGDSIGRCEASEDGRICFECDLGRAVDTLEAVICSSYAALNTGRSDMATTPLTIANSPNPFSDYTVIHYGLPLRSEVIIGIYSVPGRLVRRFVLDAQPAGQHVLRWDRRDGSGNVVAAGVYICRLRCGSLYVRQKIVVVH